MLEDTDSLLVLSILVDSFVNVFIIEFKSDLLILFTIDSKFETSLIDVLSIKLLLSFEFVISLLFSILLTVEFKSDLLTLFSVASKFDVLLIKLLCTELSSFEVVV